MQIVLTGHRTYCIVSYMARPADTTPPVVLGVSPAPGATDVAHDEPMSVTFDEPIYPFLYGSIDGVLVEVAIDYTTLTARMRPTAPLRSNVVYGGSAHLATLRTLDASGPVLAVVVGILVNARLLVYSAGLARSWPEQPRWFRLVAAPLIIDPTFAVAEQHAASNHDGSAR